MCFLNGVRLFLGNFALNVMFGYLPQRPIAKGSVLYVNEMLPLSASYRNFTWLVCISQALMEKQSSLFLFQVLPKSYKYRPLFSTWFICVSVVTD